MVRSPKDVRAVTEQRYLEIIWEEGHIGRYPYRTLRGECRCAACVDELTGVRTLDIASIADAIIIDDMRLAGNYALRIGWSDGHSAAFIPGNCCEHCVPVQGARGEDRDL